jgi:hypothetical protein
MEHSSSTQLKDFSAWLVWNEGRTRRLTADSRDGSDVVNLALPRFVLHLSKVRV